MRAVPHPPHADHVRSFLIHGSPSLGWRLGAAEPVPGISFQISPQGSSTLNQRLTAEQTLVLRQALVEELKGDLGKARASLGQFQETLNISDATAVRELLHRVAGVAQPLGLALLGTVAALGEDLLVLMARGALAATPQTVNMVRGAIARVEEFLTERPGTEGSGFILSEPTARGHQLLGTNILIVDDDMLSARLIQRCLQDAGGKTRHCRDPKEVMRFLDEEVPDLILLDLLMPGQDGFETCRRIRQNEDLVRIPIVFITRLSEVEDKVQAMRDGADDYITKPFEPNELLARVSAHVHRHVQQREQLFRDVLTGAYNLRYFRERLEREYKRVGTTHEPLAIAMLDVDHFKLVNDQHGHSAGDLALQTVVRAVGGCLRQTDVVVRYGGDEIAIILTRTSLETANEVLERVLKGVRETPLLLESGVRLRLTASAGVAALEPGETAARLLARADAALYETKRGGRDGLTVSPGATERVSA